MTPTTTPVKRIAIKRIVAVSVVPSPYQRDFFRALRAEGAPLEVRYLERTPHDSPWPESPLEPWETILPGFTFNWGSGRSHFNLLNLSPRPGDFWLVNTAMTDATGQCLMRRLGSRHLWAFWGELPSIPASPFRARLQRLQYAPLRRARFIAAVGERARQAYHTLAPHVPAFNLPYACNLFSFDRARQNRPSRLPNDAPVFLFCGQMISRKGIDILLEAFARLVRAGSPARLLLIGREADLANQLASLPGNIRSRISYEGFQAPEALPSFFARADVFVLPSRHDGWGVVVNQALGAGLPVILSDAVGASELISSDREGIVVPAGNIEALTLALDSLASDPVRRTRMAAAAIARAKSLSPEAAAQSWLEKIHALAVSPA